MDTLVEFLLLPEIDFPPVSLLYFLTHDQQIAWRATRDYWNILHKKLKSGYFQESEKPAYEIKQVTDELSTAQANLYLAFYEVIRLSWDEIERDLLVPELSVKSPESLFITYLLFECLIQFSEYINDCSFSPQRWNQDPSNYAAGAPIGGRAYHELNSELRGFIKKLKNPKIIEAIKDCKKLEAERLRLFIKHTHKSRGVIKGFQMKDGVYIPPKKHKVYKSKSPKENPPTTEKWEAAYEKKRKYCEKCGKRRLVNRPMVCKPCFNDTEKWRIKNPQNVHNDSEHYEIIVFIPQEPS
jgi:hypothetical protein